MKIQEMRMILAIISEGSISSAAKKLYIAQPSLSQCVKKIEQELGVPLFIRQTGKLLTPTKSGLLYAEAAKEILNIYDDFLEKLEPEVSSDKPSLRIGVPSRQGNRIIEAIFSDEALIQTVVPSFTDGNANDLELLLINGELDLAVIRLPLKLQNLEFETVYHEPLGIWLRRGSPLSEKAVLHPGDDYPSLPLEILKNEPFILPPTEKRIRATIDNIFNDHDISPKVIATYQNQSSILLMVQQGVCSTIGRYPSAGSTKNMDFYKIENCKRFYELAVVYPSNTNHKKSIRSICSDLKKHFNTMTI